MSSVPRSKVILPSKPTTFNLVNRTFHPWNNRPVWSNLEGQFGTFNLWTNWAKVLVLFWKGRFGHFPPFETTGPSLVHLERAFGTLSPLNKLGPVWFNPEGALRHLSPLDNLAKLVHLKAVRTLSPLTTGQLSNPEGQFHFHLEQPAGWSILRAGRPSSLTTVQFVYLKGVQPPTLTPCRLPT